MSEGGVLGSDDPPTRVTRRDDGSVREEEWRYRGGLDRIDGPALVTYRDTGEVQMTGWYRGGKLHRVGGPAQTTIGMTGRRTEIFYREGLVHRVEGPAVIRSSGTGAFVRELFYLFGEKRTAEEVATYRSALESGAPAEWALAYALGETG